MYLHNFGKIQLVEKQSGNMFNFFANRKFTVNYAPVVEIT